MENIAQEKYWMEISRAFFSEQAFQRLSNIFNLLMNNVNTYTRKFIVLCLWKSNQKNISL